MKHRYFFFFSFLLLNLWGFSQAPVANFSSNITGGCSPIVVNFNDLSTGGPTSWQWDFGNGAQSSKQNPSATYFDEGTYKVTLTATNSSGSNTVTKTAYITVYLPPVADFVADRRTGCTPAVIQFADRSATPAGTTITGWKWDFGDGGSSTEQNPKYVYRTAGTYTVTLLITNDKGCTKLIQKPNYMDLTKGVVPAFSYVDPAVCSAPATINFTNKSTGPGSLSYSWNLGNGATSNSLNTSTTYTTNGTYKAVLIVSSNQGCTDSLVRNIVVGKATTDFIVPAQICPKTPVQFINNSTPRSISSIWKFPNGKTDTLRNGIGTFDSVGVYEVVLINKYVACTDTFRKNVSVNPAPKVDFIASDTGKCQPSFTVNFTNNTNATSFKWDFGDGATSTEANASHTYTKEGEFDVTLIASSGIGCADTLKKKAYIKIKKPVITFPGLPATGCIPHTVDFDPLIVSADRITSYSWNFGDGTGSSSSAKPSYTYTQQGTYKVTLTITTSGGCTEVFSLDDAVKVGTEPVAEFTSDGTVACAQPGIKFINQSTNALEYYWQFSDGTSSKSKDPQHTFSNVGNIDVTLFAINNGCSTSIKKDNYALIRPSVSKFQYKPNCDNRLQYTFTDASIGANTWSWDFGDGSSPYVGKNPPLHTFPSAGTYDVSLTTTNGSCTYKLTRKITIADNTPNFTSEVREGCKSFTPTLIPSSPNAKLIKDYEWYFGEGAPINFGHSSYGQYTYTKSGNYSVTLTTIDTFGCRHSITKNDFIKVYGAAPNFGSITNAGCKGLTTTFIDSSKTDGTNSITEWRWDFGDSTSQTYTAPPYQHTYDSVGDYDVKLVITDNKGCTDSITKRAFVKISILKADFKNNAASCPGASLYFENKTESDLPYTSLWSFGDGNNSVVTSPSHKYLDTGQFSVQLKVQDIIGCVDSVLIKDPVQVSRPVASFTENNLTSYCVPFEAKFTNTSTFYQSSLWDLSNGTSNQTNPSRYYTDKGVYPIKLVVTSPGGCKDSISKTLSVFQPEDGKITYSPIVGCRPLPVNFEAFSAMNGNFIWDFGDGNVIDTNLHQITHIYDDPGPFVPRIILRQSSDCILPILGSTPIEIWGAKAKFRLSQTLFCDSGFVSVIDSTTSRDRITRYTWDFGDGTITNEQNPNHYYSEPGNYIVSLKVDTETGCKDSITLNPGAKVVQSPLINVGGDTELCVSERFNHLGIFERSDTSFVRWNWRFPNGNNSILQNPVQQQYQPGTYTVTTIATNSSGCADTATKTIIVNPLPVITLPASLTKVVGVPMILPATYSSNVTEYLWNPAPTLDCNTCPQPVATPKFTTLYSVAVVDSNGCRNISQVQVIVVCKGVDLFVPNTFSPNGDGSNDIFYIRGTGLDRVKSLRIFNRWGEIVFEQKDFPVNNPAYGWNGTYKGNKATADVYVYQVEIFCENSELMRFEGNVALIQ
ncbi:MAG: PKD domain-containing protein [Chitinophagaceae bacterium]